MHKEKEKVDPATNEPGKDEPTQDTIHEGKNEQHREPDAELSTTPHGKYQAPSVSDAETSGSKSSLEIPEEQSPTYLTSAREQGIREDKQQEIAIPKEQIDSDIKFTKFEDSLVNVSGDTSPRDRSDSDLTT